MKTKHSDKIEVRYIPLPPEKRAEWDRAMQLLVKLLLEILREQKEGSASKPADAGNQVTF